MSAFNMALFIVHVLYVVQDLAFVLGMYMIISQLYTAMFTYAICSNMHT